MNVTTMITALGKIEEELPALLRDDVGWMSLNINYHPPLVQRLWRQHGDNRIYLHKIEPCQRQDALMHPHPWPSAMRVIEGAYEMGIGYGTGAGGLTPPLAATIYQEGGLFVYEMLDPQGWHYVRPVNGPVTSIMVSGKPWPNALKQGPIPLLGPLHPKAHHDLLMYFREVYQ